MKNVRMNFLISIWFVMGTLSNGHSQTNKKSDIPESEEKYWTLEDARIQAEKYNNPENWETETIEMEIEELNEFPPRDIPLYHSPFPTPDYYSPGNGNGGIELEIANKVIVGHYAVIAKGEHSQHLFRKFNDTTEQYATYFTILTISDEKDSSSPIEASSRNHPNYLSQGSLNTSTKSRVDWVALQLADKNAYAIVNGRIFDLRVGRIILSAPQKDGSIRFFQTDAPPMSPKERDLYLEKLKKNKEALKFFRSEKNIRG